MNRTGIGVLALTVVTAMGLAAEPSPQGEPRTVNLALGAAVEARSSMESHPRTAARHLTDGIVAAGGYQSRPARVRVVVGLDLGGFSGAWRDVSHKGALGGTFVLAGKVDDAFEYTFEGDEIAWIGARNSDHGQAEVSIDGKVAATVDTRADKLEFQQELFRRKLAPGRHVFRLRISTPGMTADPERWPDGMQIAGKLARENGFKLTLYFMRCNSTMEWGKRLSQAMKEYGATTYRSDFGAPGGPAGIAMLDWLIANHPGFRYEHCDCGGAQKDFVMAQRASGIYGIDVYDPLSNRKMFHVSSYCLPPVQLQCPIDDIFTAPVYALRSSMQGAMYIGMGFGKGAMPSECPMLIEPMKANVALFKNRLRPLLRGGDLYHLTLRPDGIAWDGLQYQHPVSGKGAVLLFKPASKADTRRFYLRGLDRAKTYALTFQDRPEQNMRKTGAELMDHGFDVTIPGQHVSEIIWIDAGQS